MARLRLSCGYEPLEEKITAQLLMVTMAGSTALWGLLRGIEVTVSSSGNGDVPKEQFPFGTSKILGVSGSQALVPKSHSESRLCQS